MWKEAKEVIFQMPRAYNVRVGSHIVLPRTCHFSYISLEIVQTSTLLLSFLAYWC